jgi:hypothetical protein
MVASVDQYVSMAGRSCCAGRSWNGLDRSLSRHGVFDTAEDCELAKAEDHADGIDEPSGVPVGSGSFARPTSNP